MLPPIPQGVVAPTLQQDPVKPRPDIPPVVPVQQDDASRDVGLRDAPPDSRQPRRKPGKAIGRQAPEEDASDTPTDADSRVGRTIDIQV